MPPKSSKNRPEIRQMVTKSLVRMLRFMKWGPFLVESARALDHKAARMSDERFCVLRAGRAQAKYGKQR